MLTLIFDTETTGLISNSAVPLSKQPRLIEYYGALVRQDGTVHSDLDFICNPGISISDEIKRITGLSDTDTAGQPPFSSYAAEIQKQLASADAVVAHNLSYDMSILDNEMQRLGSSLVWPDRRVCTVEATQHYKGFRLSLQALHEHLFGEGFPSAHRARNDVGALIRCWNELSLRDDV